MLAAQTGGRGITSPPALDDVVSVAKSPMTPTQGGRASVVSPKVLDPSDLDQLGPEDRIAVMNMVKEVRCGCFAHEQALATHASVALSLEQESNSSVNATSPPTIMKTQSSDALALLLPVLLLPSSLSKLVVPMAGGSIGRRGRIEGQGRGGLQESGTGRQGEQCKLNVQE